MTNALDESCPGCGPIESVEQTSATRCGYRLPLGVLQHECLPSRHLCQTCFMAHLLPEPQFGRETSIGRRCSDAPSQLPAVGRPPKLLPSRARLATGRTGP
ncbi:MAG: hypothetical protein ACRDRA_19995, partial [Pseudonocardiaceae bacterium]